MPPIASLTSTPAAWPARAITRSCPLPHRSQYSGKNGNKLNRTSRQAGRSGHNATQRQRHPTCVSGNTGKKIGKSGNDSGNEIGNRGKGNATAKTAGTPARRGLPGTILATATALAATPARKSATPSAKAASGGGILMVTGGRLPPKSTRQTPATAAATVPATSAATSVAAGARPLPSKGKRQGARSATSSATIPATKNGNSGNAAICITRSAYLPWLSAPDEVQCSE